MSWQSLVRETIKEENPQLHQKLSQEGTLIEHAAGHARALTDACRMLTPDGADEAAKAQAREIAIAEMREQIRAERIDESEYDEDGLADPTDVTGWRWG